MKAWALRPHRQAPQSQAAANRGFPSRSRVVEDNRSEPTAQHAAFGLIQRSARVLAQRHAFDALHESPRMVAQRNTFASMFRRPAVAGSQSSVIQRLPQIVDEAYEGNAGGRAGASMLLIRLDGTIGKEGANNPKNPKTLVPGHQQLLQGYKFGYNEPFAMHLVNGRLGGSGTNPLNLAWGSHNFNTKHCRMWEQALQNTAEDQNYAGCYMLMTVVAVYKSGDQTKAGYYYLHALGCSCKLYDPQGKLFDEPADVDILDDKQFEPEDRTWSPTKGDPNWANLWT